MSIIQKLTINPQDEAEKIEKFISTQLNDLGKDGVVLGLSGGLDSSVCAYLCTRVLRKDKIFTLILPEKDNNPLNMEHAELISKTLGLTTKTINLTSFLEQIGVYKLFTDEERSNKEKVEKLIKGLGKVLKTPSLFATGMSFQYDGKFGLKEKIERKLLLPYSNKFLALTYAKVRLRMLLLYYYAALNNYLVIGTTDKTEWTVGFYDKYGDGANDITLLRHLYKTQIRQLASYLGVPKEIIQKPSSGDLIAKLPNEVIMGFTYEQLDQILYGLERGMQDKDIAEEVGIDIRSIQAIKTAITMEQVKREMPRYL
ncbi:NAD(+) synthase [Patescibacteria group bacterium]|nr:NAD(+) synthase [Patescibacteria group bacterium]